ncbi:MAG: flagellar basal body rod protein FlgB [Pseudomonadales bacterium]
MKIGFDAALGVHPAALALRARRTEVLANNLANADTPNFKARDLDFKAVMAAQSQPADGRLRTTHTRHMEPSSTSPDSTSPDRDLMYRNPSLPSLDGNTVEGHVEQAEFADNSVNFMASLRFLDGKFQSLRTAIKGE